MTYSSVRPNQARFWVRLRQQFTAGMAVLTLMLLAVYVVPCAVSQDNSAVPPEASEGALAILAIKRPVLVMVEVAKYDKAPGGVIYIGSYKIKDGDKPIDVAKGLAKDINDLAGKEIVKPSQDGDYGVLTIIPKGYAFKVQSQPGILIGLP